MTNRLLFALGAIAGTIAMPITSYAYECSVAKACPINQSWSSRTIDFYINDTSVLLQGDERKQLVQSAFATWSAPTCTDIKFNYRGTTQMGAAFDDTNLMNNQNVILAAANPNDLAMFDSADELAKTIVTYVNDTGQIVDADMMLNGLNRPFAEVTDPNLCAMQRPPPYDLLETITHEAGHFIGFDHSPDPESTMYATAQPCETKKRDLTADDILGLCTVYPAMKPNGQCPPDHFLHPCTGQTMGCGCTGAEGERAPPAIIAALLAGVMLLFLRRSRAAE